MPAGAHSYSNTLRVVLLMGYFLTLLHSCHICITAYCLAHINFDTTKSLKMRDGIDAHVCCTFFCVLFACIFVHPLVSRQEVTCPEERHFKHRFFFSVFSSKYCAREQLQLSLELYATYCTYAHTA